MIEAISKAFVPGLVIGFPHCIFLALVQSSTAETIRLAVNFQYLSSMIVGLGIGAILFRRHIFSQMELDLSEDQSPIECSSDTRSRC